MKKKGDFKASTFIYSMIFVIAIFGVLWGFNSKLSQNYGVAVPDQYNQTFQIITETSGIDNTTAELKSLAFKDDVNSTRSFFGKLEDRFDVLGLYFRLGYETLSYAPKSIKIFSLMSESVLDSSGGFLGSSVSFIRFLVISLIMVAFVFLLIAVAVKWWV